MNLLEFIIPTAREELLRVRTDAYSVLQLVGEKELRSKLTEVKLYLKEQGAEFILDNFDTYFSVYYYHEKLSLEILYTAYRDLHIAVGELAKQLGFILNDKDNIIDELKFKYNKILKMLLFIYVKIAVTLEQRNEKLTQELQYKEGKKKKATATDADTYCVDKVASMVSISHVLQHDIGVFWDPPIADDVLVNTVADMCYRFLELGSIKTSKEARIEIFHVFGNLIARYHHSMTFVVRLVQLIKIHEHVAQIVHEGIELLVRQHACSSMIRELVREMTEWQTEEQYQDSQGTRNCATVLTNMATAMSELMLPEVVYLQNYLTHESPNLRNSILAVIVEVILTVLTKPDLSDEHRQFRDELIDILTEHIRDTAAQVRAKVFQHWARLQKEDSVPLKVQSRILGHVVAHLCDKSALVRKSAANCLAAFLKFNKYAAHLNLDELKGKLFEKRSELLKKQAEMGDTDAQERLQYEEEWEKHEAEIKRYISINFDTLSTDDVPEIQEKDLPQTLREYVAKKYFKTALNLCYSAFEKAPMWKEVNSALSDRHDFFFGLVHSLFITTTVDIGPIQSDGKDSNGADDGSGSNSDDNNTSTRSESNRNKSKSTAIDPNEVNGFNEELLNEVIQLKCVVEYYENAVAYLELINSALQPMCGLLRSAAAGDMAEAVAFFIAASQFGIKNFECGILTMFTVMRRCEPDRKTNIVNALKKIYLVTDGENTSQHCIIVVERLIKLVKEVTYLYVNDFKTLIAEWVSKGTVDNQIIDTLWKYYLRRVSCSDEDSRAALQLLGMASLGRPSIINRNVKLISETAFAESRRYDLLLFNDACVALCLGFSEKPVLTAKDPPTRLKLTEPLWQDVITIIVDNFTKPVSVFTEPISSAVTLIYKLCSKPERLIEQLLSKVLSVVNESAISVEVDPLSQKSTQTPNVPTHSLKNYIIIRCVHLFGAIAFAQLNHLDEAVYKEMKRRQFILEEKKNPENAKSGNDLKKNNNRKRKMQDCNTSTASMQSNSSIRTNANSTFRNASEVVNSTNTTDDADESMLEGAQGEDADAEFITHTLESSTISKLTCLGILSKMIIHICQRPDLYDDVDLQCSAVIALMRYMLVSSVFCTEHIQLIFTMLEKSSYPSVKCNILIHCSDILERFPNQIEPWSDRIYHRLKDEHLEVRRTTFYILSNLLLRDMIRIKGESSSMAGSIVDKNPEISQMAKHFFQDLSQKSCNMHNFLPDIFSHLCAEKYSTSDIQTIMAFLFDLVSKDRVLESLVDRFCLKYTGTFDNDVLKNITYCLSLIQYNEKMLRKLVESFQSYKHAIFINDVYIMFKKIMAACSKTNKAASQKGDLKPLVAELESLIEKAFGAGVDSGAGTRIDDPEGGEQSQPVVFKKPRTVVPKSAIGRRRGGRKPLASINNESDSDETSRRASTRRLKAKYPVESDEEDSD